MLHMDKCDIFERNLIYIMHVGMDYVPRLHVPVGAADADKRAQNHGIYGVFGLQYVS